MRLPLSRFEAARFRGLSDLVLDGLARVNLFVGQNNTGKTSVLEAISLVSAPLDPLAWVNVASRREPQFGLRTVIERLRWLFPQSASQGPDAGYQGSIALAIAGRSPLERVEATYQDLRSVLESAPQGGQREPSFDEEVESQAERRGVRIDVALTRKSVPGSQEMVDTESAETTPYDHWFRALPARWYSDAQRDAGGADSVSPSWFAERRRAWRYWASVLRLQQSWMPTTSEPRRSGSKILRSS